MSLLFNTLSRIVMVSLPRNKCLLISWLQSPSIVILELKKIKSLTVSIVSPFICHEWWDRMPWSPFFECWVLSQLFHCPLSLPSRGSLVPLCFLPLEWCYLHIWGCWYFSWESWLQPGISHDALYIWVKLAGWQSSLGSWQICLLGRVCFRLCEQEWRLGG